MTEENEGILMQRIRNQLRIHWGWLKEEKDYNEVADAIGAWMRQALSRHPRIVQQLIKDKDKNFKKWANQKVIIECNMLQAETLKLNNMNEAYQKWLDKMIHIVCKEEFEKRKNDGPSKIQQDKKKVK